MKGVRVTFYQSNREVRPAGAEIEEFATESDPAPPDPPGDDHRPEPEADRTDEGHEV